MKKHFEHYDEYYSRPLRDKDYYWVTAENAGNGNSRARLIVQIPPDMEINNEQFIIGMQNCLGDYVREGNLLKFWRSTSVVPQSALELAANLIREARNLKKIHKLYPEEWESIIKRWSKF